jgi:TetR/AcrR family transcriptional regulator, transcriptional repressor for nem operon
MLDAAMRVFWHRGFRATTTRDLERALGLGQSSISRAFGTKAELADAALARYVEHLEASLIKPLRDGPEGLGAIDRFLAELSEWHCADGGRGCLVGRLMCEGAQAEPRIAARVGSYRAVLRSAIDAALERAVEAGETLAGDPEERRNLVVAIVLGLNLAVQAGYDVPAQRALARAGRAQVASWGAQTGNSGEIGRAAPPGTSASIASATSGSGRGSPTPAVSPPSTTSTWPVM